MGSNTLMSRQNGCHFTDAIFKCIFLNENVCISINISLRFVPTCPINNIPALVQIMASVLTRRQAVIWTNDGLGYRRIYVSLDLNELDVQTLVTSWDIGNKWQRGQEITKGFMGPYLVPFWNRVLGCNFNSLWPRDAICQQISGSTLAQVMACCLMAPSHNLNQCWLIIYEVLFHTS